MTIQEITSLFFPNGTDILADTIGPQGNLLEKLDIFNTKYMLPDKEAPLRVTKTWRWEPGTYDRVKVAYNRKVLQWHKRPRGMRTLFERKRTYFENDIKRDLLDIEKYLIDSRRDSAIWLDSNTDNGILEQYLFEFCSKIKSFENSLSDEVENWEITPITQALAHRANYNRNDPDDIIPGLFLMKIYLPEKPINVTKDEKLVTQIRFPALTMYIKIDICKWMSHSITNRTVNDNYNAPWNSYFGIAFDFKIPKNWFSNEFSEDELFEIGSWPIYHPFIYNRGNQFAEGNHSWYWKNYCWGDFGDQILTSFCNCCNISLV